MVEKEKIIIFLFFSFFAMSTIAFVADVLESHISGGQLFEYFLSVLMYHFLSHGFSSKTKNVFTPMKDYAFAIFCYASVAIFISAFIMYFFDIRFSSNVKVAIAFIGIYAYEYIYSLRAPIA